MSKWRHEETRVVARGRGELLELQFGETDTDRHFAVSLEYHPGETADIWAARLEKLAVAIRHSMKREGAEL